MYKTILLFLFLLLCFLNFASAEVLNDKVNGYKLEYPANWKKEEFFNSRDLVKANIMKDKITGVQVRLESNRNMDFNGFKQWYVGDFINQMQARWGGSINIVDQGCVIIAGRTGCFFSFDMLRQDNQGRFFKVFLVPYKNNMLILQCGTSFSERKKNEPVINSIAKSIVFIK